MTQTPRIVTREQIAALEKDPNYQGVAEQMELRGLWKIVDSNKVESGKTTILQGI